VESTHISAGFEILAGNFGKSRIRNYPSRKIHPTGTNFSKKDMVINPHHKFMQAALEEARSAYAEWETPVGAVVVMNGEIIGSGRNEVEVRRDPAAHAETLAMRRAAVHIGEKRLEKAVLYTTLEPCVMCASMAVLYRIVRIVYGAADLRWGGCGTVFNIVQDERLNHRIEIIGGIMEEECGSLLREFFGKRRG
jgi:tRNA(adenine34) deaminase